MRRQPLRIFDDFFVQERHSDFKTVSHGKLVCIHQKLIGQRGTQLQKTKASKLVSLAHQRSQIAPRVENFVSGTAGNDSVLKEPVDFIAWEERQDVLISAHPVGEIQRIDAPLKGLVSRQGANHRAYSRAHRLRQTAPILSIPNSKVTTVTA